MSTQEEVVDYFLNLVLPTSSEFFGIQQIYDSQTVGANSLNVIEPSNVNVAQTVDVDFPLSTKEIVPSNEVVVVLFK